MSLTTSEKNYHLGSVEFLALKWAITEQFKEYLHYQPFTMWTDNNLLTYLYTIPNLDTCRHRFVASLANFTFTVEYQHRKIKATGALSRVNECLNAKEVKAILDGTSTGCRECAKLPMVMKQLGEDGDLV